MELYYKTFARCEGKKLINKAFDVLRGGKKMMQLKSLRLLDNNCTCWSCVYTGLSNASSSLSSGELLDACPKTPASPSTASLQLQPSPILVELGGKSSSAPLLENDVNNSKNKELVIATNFNQLDVIDKRDQLAFFFAIYCQFLLLAK